MSDPFFSLNASTYARDKIKKLRCLDKDIVAKYPGIEWISQNERRIYPCPDGLDCDGGTCRITSSELCNKISQLPYNDDDGSDIKTRICKKDADCSEVGYPAVCGDGSGGDDHKDKMKRNGKLVDNVCLPTKSYLEWHPEDPTIFKGGGRCVYGNGSLRKWCKFPKTRIDPIDDPGFNYNESNSQCEMSPEYCYKYKVDYKDGPPQCYEKNSQKTAEFFLGKTIFRAFKKKKKLDNGSSTSTTQQQESLTNENKTVTRLVDRSYMDTVKKVKDDFGGKGIHLYLVNWKTRAQKLDKDSVGTRISFLASEIEKVYPEIVFKEKRAKFITITHEDLIRNPALKRIYIASGSSKWMANSIGNRNLG